MRALLLLPGVLPKGRDFRIPSVPGETAGKITDYNKGTGSAGSFIIVWRYAFSAKAAVCPRLYFEAGPRFSLSRARIRYMAPNPVNTPVTTPEATRAGA